MPQRNKRTHHVNWKKHFEKKFIDHKNSLEEATEDDRQICLEVNSNQGFMGKLSFSPL